MMRDAGYGIRDTGRGIRDARTENCDAGRFRFEMGFDLYIVILYLVSLVLQLASLIP